MLSPNTKFCHRSLPTRRRTMRFGRLLLACLACGARGYTAPARPGSSRIARSHGPAMGPTLPPMPPMPEDLPRLDGIGSLPPLPGLPSVAEDQPPWAVQMWVDLLDVLGAIAGAFTSGDTEALARVASDPHLLLFVPVGLAVRVRVRVRVGEP